MGELVAICVSEEKGVQKRRIESGTLLENFGLEGDAHGGSWHRQVSLLALRDIEAMRAKGLPDLKDGDFGENLVVKDVELDQLGLGSRLRIGAETELTITQRGKVCHNRCAIFHQAGDCIMPRSGIFARVVRGGAIAVGDPVETLEPVPADRLQAVVLTISDKGSRGERTDTAGPAVANLLRQEVTAHIYASEILPDEQKQIAERLRHYADGHNIDLVVAVGGTGFSPRDVTPEAIRETAERLTPGFDEVMRAASLQKTPHAMLSRAVSGICGQTLLLSLPGSERAATENLSAILPALPHGLAKLRGDSADCAVSPAETSGKGNL